MGNSKSGGAPTSVFSMVFRNVCSVSFLGSFLMVAYMGMGMFNLYRLMNPLYGVDLSLYPPDQMVHPLWEPSSDAYEVWVYLSNSDRFTVDYFVSDSERDKKKSPLEAVRLWAELIVPGERVNTRDGSSPSFREKTFVLTTEEECRGGGGDDLEGDDVCVPRVSSRTKIGIPEATSWFLEEEEDDAKEQWWSRLREKIGSTSVLGTAYGAVRDALRKLSNNADDNTASAKPPPSPPDLRRFVRDHPLWKNVARKRTDVYLHVATIRHPLATKRMKVETLLEQDRGDEASSNKIIDAFRSMAQEHRVVLGSVPLIKLDDPIPVKPKRKLIDDLRYLADSLAAAVTGQTKTKGGIPPWDVAQSQPKEHRAYERALADRSNGVGHPYWIPEISIRMVDDGGTAYPMDLVYSSGMTTVRIAPKDRRPRQHPSGLAYQPHLHVDEMSLTSEKRVCLNSTVTALPLAVRLDFRSDAASSISLENDGGGSLSPQRWRLLQHFSQSLQSQKEMGLFRENDIDDVKRLVTDTNVYLLAITFLASALHLLFEFLTLKSDVDFWRANTDLTGLSVRALFLDCIGQFIILLYLIESDSSILMTGPSAAGVAIAAWKCQRGAGFRFVRVTSAETPSLWWFNRLLRTLSGHELRATRLVSTYHADDGDHSNSNRNSTSGNTAKDLARLTEESDQLATRLLGGILGPCVIVGALYTLVVDEYAGWYSWLVTSSSGAVYALGFCLMTPQLFLNYRLKSVAHLPWKVLGYRFVNTFVDDLFAFIIRMPTMARISCFRDDIVFFVYLLQRHWYPVDTSRPAEGVGGSEEVIDTATTATKEAQKKTQ